MSAALVVSPGLLFTTSTKPSVVPAAATTNVQVVSAMPATLGWTPATSRQMPEERSRHAPASRSTSTTLRSRTPPERSRPAASQPLTVEAMASMPVAFRSASSPGVRGDSLRRVLCYGDSLTAGFCSGGKQFEPYGRALAEALGNAGVPNSVLVCGHSGGTASEFVAKKDSSLVDVVGCRGKGLARILSEDGPFDVVIIMAGTNDLGRTGGPKDVLRSVKALHEECHARGIPTIAVPPPPAPLRTAAQEAVRLQTASLIEDWTKRAVSGRVFYQDPAEFVPSNSKSGWIFESDKLHFTPAGSRHLGEGLANVILSNGCIAAPARAAARFQMSPPVTPHMQPRSGPANHSVVAISDSIQATRTGSKTSSVVAHAMRCGSSVVPPLLQARNVRMIVM